MNRFVLLTCNIAFSLSLVYGQTIESGYALSSKNHPVQEGDESLSSAAQEALNAQFQAVSSTLEQQRNSLEQLRSSFNKQKQDLTAKTEELSRLKSEQTSDLKNYQDNISSLNEVVKNYKDELQTKIGLIDKLNTRHRQDAETLEQERNTLEKLSAAFDQKQYDLAAKELELAKLKAEQAQQISQHQGMLSHLNTTLKGQKQEIEARAKLIEELHAKRQLDLEAFEEEKTKLAYLSIAFDKKQDEFNGKEQELGKLKAEHAQTIQLHEKAISALNLQISAYKTDLGVKATLIEEINTRHLSDVAHLTAEKEKTEKLSAAFAIKQNELAQREQEVVKLKAEQASQLKMHQQAAATLNREIAQHIQELETKTALIDQLNSRHRFNVESLERDRASLEKLNVSLKELQTNFEEKKTELEELKEEQAQSLSHHQGAIAALNLHLKNQKQELEAKTAQFVELTAARQSDASTLDSQKITIGKLEAALDKGQRELMIKVHELEKLQATHDQNVIQHKEELAALNLELKTQRNMTAEKMHHIEDQTAKLQNHQLSLQQQKNSLEQIASELAKKDALLISREQEVSGIKAEQLLIFKSHQEELAALNAKLNEYSQEIENKTKALTALGIRRQSDAEALEKHRVNIEKLTTNLEHKQTLLQIKEQELIRLKTEQTSSVSQTQGALAALNINLNGLREALEEKTKQIEALTLKNQALASASEEQSATLEKLKSAYEQKQHALGFKEQEFEKLKTLHAQEVAKSQSALAALTHQLKNQAQEMESLKLLHTQEIAKTQSAVTSYESTASALEQKKNELEILQTLYAKQKQESSAQLAELNQLRHQYPLGLAALEKQKSDLNELLATLDLQKQQLFAKTEELEELTAKYQSSQLMFGQQKASLELANQTIASTADKLRVFDAQRQTDSATLEQQRKALEQVKTTLEIQKQEAAAKAQELNTLYGQRRIDMITLEQQKAELYRLKQELFGKADQLKALTIQHEADLALIDQQKQELDKRKIAFNVDWQKFYARTDDLNSLTSNAGLNTIEAIELQKVGLEKLRDTFELQKKDLDVKAKTIQELLTQHDLDLKTIDEQCSGLSHLSSVITAKTQDFASLSQELENERKNLLAKTDELSKEKTLHTQDLKNHEETLATLTKDLENERKNLLAKTDELSSIKIHLEKEQQQLTSTKALQAEEIRKYQEIAESLKAELESQKKNFEGQAKAIGRISANPAVEQIKSNRIKLIEPPQEPAPTPEASKRDSQIFEKPALENLQASLDNKSYLVASQPPYGDPFLPPPTAEPVERRGTHFPIPQRFTISHVQGTNEGIGFGTDYSTVGMLLASDYFLGQVMPMIDLRVHRFDDNSYAANAGIGGRYIPAPNTFCELLGFNAFYDYREGNKGNYNQVGVGLEVLGKRWDFRANAYFPIGVKRHKTTCVFDDYDGDFCAIHRSCEFTSYGFNAEVGYTSPTWKNFLLYGAAGPYYLVRKCHDKTVGGRVRLRPQYKDYAAVDLSWSYDPVFHSVFQLQVILYLPFYQIFSRKDREPPCGITERQVYQPIERFEVMPLGRKSCWESNF